MGGVELLGAAAVDGDTLAAMVARRHRLAGEVTLTGVEVTDHPYAWESITTSGRHLVHGQVSTSGGPVDFSFFVKVIRSFSRSPLFATVPPHLREMATASVPWRTEPLAYRSDLVDRLPVGLTMPRAVAVLDLDESTIAIWLDVIAVADRAWDAERYGRAAYLLGRLSGSAAVAERAGVGEFDWTLRTYLAGRLGHQVVPMLHDDGLWNHPLVSGAFDPSLRARLLDTADRVADLVEEAMTLPHLAAHGDACPNNLLTTPEDLDFTLIDYGFWMPAPVGADLGQLLVGNVQIGLERAGDLAARDDAHIAAYVAGLRDEGCEVAEPVVRRAHALHHVLMTGLSSVPWELLGQEVTPGLRAQAEDRAAIARFCLDRLDASAPR